MNLNELTLRSSILGGSLALAASASLIAAAQSATNLPQQPNHGSTQVSKKDECDMVKLSQLAVTGPTQAVEATMGSTSTADKVIETRLKADNQFLVWEVKSVRGDGTVTEMDVDASTGEVLAMHQAQNNGQGSQVNGGPEDNGQGSEDSGQDNECE